jgi:hypothetical protein
MPAVVPSSAVGYYVLIWPREFWNSAWLEGDYAKVATEAIRHLDTPRERLLEVSVETLIRSSIDAIGPDIRELPLEHPKRQRVLRLHKVSLAIFAHLMDARYFALVFDGHSCRFERIEATSIKHAQELIMQRADVQAIERDHPFSSWQPTILH